MGGFGQLGNQEEPQYLNRKGLRSREHNSIAMKSRMMGDHQVRFRERLVVKFHRPTRQLTVRNFREGLGNNGIIRSPFSAKTLLDRDHGSRTEVLSESKGMTTGA
jgi:hypothetical protein